eukprot:EG_transcript_24235
MASPAPGAGPGVGEGPAAGGSGVVPTDNKEGLHRRNVKGSEEVSAPTTAADPPPPGRTQEVLLRTMQLCHQCRGTRNDLRPGGSGCRACQSTGLVPKEWLRCVKCNGTGNDPNDAGVECKPCGSTGHLKNFSRNFFRQPCFKCGGTGNDEKCTSLACTGCDSTGYIPSEVQRCFKCQGSGNDCYSASPDGCNACGGGGHLSGEVTRCSQCKGSGLDPDTATLGCSMCSDRGFIGSHTIDKNHEESIKAEEVEPDP